MKRIFLPVLLVLLFACLTACVITPPEPGEQATVQQTAAQTEMGETVIADGTTDAPATEVQTQAPETESTPETTEEITTYGELHFPEESE